ncbi:MAG: glycosyltransferase family 8 protein [Rickettsiales bacterium]|nr:glycosyltransferase family 8 protein [Rickettsiales bacterium]
MFLQNMKFVKTIILSLTLMTMHSSPSLSLNNNQHIPVFLAADDNYAPFVATTMASILKNTKSHVDFYVLSDGITAKNKAKIANERKWFKNFSLRFVEIDKILPTNLRVTDRFPKAMYGRFLIPEINKNFKKAIYLDDDIIVKGDIKELYDDDLSGYALGAAPWVTSWIIGGSGNKRLKKIDKNCSLEHKYFNSGVLLIDAEKWRNNKIFDKLMENATKYADNQYLTLPDQDILNIVFNLKVKVLDRRFNNRTHDLEDYIKENDGDQKFKDDLFKKTVVIHYASPQKPWLSKTHTYANEFWQIVPYTDFADEIKQIHDNYQRDMKIMKNSDKTAKKVSKYIRHKLNIVYMLFGILIGLNVAVLFVVFRRKKR